MTHYPLPRSTPEAQGVASTAISAFLTAVTQQEIELHSLMLVRHGHVVAEGWWSPYRADAIHLLYSLSKSFTSTAIGLAVEEGRLTVDDPVLSFFPGRTPAYVSAHLATMRVHHLLCMATGHREDALERMIQQGGDDWVAGFFAVPPDQEPGTIFAYNNAATFLLSAILQEVTGSKLVDYLQPRLFAPLGIEEKRWSENPQGINLGYSGLHITTEAIARFGQLYLQKGEWQGQQLVPAQWIETATAHHIATRPAEPAAEPQKPDWWQGYGYQFWHCRHQTYRGDGAFGQFCLVMPEQDAVLATTAGVADMQVVLDLVWANLLPAMASSPLRDNPVTQATLANQLAHLVVQPAHVESATPMVAGFGGKRYVFRAVDSMLDDSTTEDFSTADTAVDTTADQQDDDDMATLHFGDQYARLEANIEDDIHQILCGYAEWIAGTTTVHGEEAAVLSRGIWTAPDTFTVWVRFIETPHSLTFDFHLGEEDMRLHRRWNVHFGPVELPLLQG